MTFVSGPPHRRPSLGVLQDGASRGRRADVTRDAAAHRRPGREPVDLHGAVQYQWKTRSSRY